MRAIIDGGVAVKNGRAQKLAWFVGIWAASVATLGIIAFLIKGMIK